jgi:hypothetical protein
MNARPLDSESEAVETDESRGNREPHGRNRSSTRYGKVLALADILRRQFRMVAQSLTRRVAPMLERQGRSGHSGKGSMPVPAMRHDEATAPEAEDFTEFICETLDWMNPFYYDTGSFDEFGAEHQIEQDYFYPQP